MGALEGVINNTRKAHLKEALSVLPGFCVKFDYHNIANKGEGSKGTTCQVFWLKGSSTFFIEVYSTIPFVMTITEPALSRKSLVCFISMGIKEND